MTSQIVLPQGTYAIGSRTLGPVTIPTGVSSASLALSGTSMTNAALSLSLTLDLSLDGGVTWASTAPSHATDPFPVKVADMRGGQLDRSGAARATYYISVWGIPDPNNVNRQVRALVTISGTSLTTQGTLTLN